MRNTTTCTRRRNAATWPILSKGCKMPVPFSCHAAAGGRVHFLVGRFRRRLRMNAGFDDDLKGQIDSELIQAMTSKISNALGTRDVSVLDVSGDGQHVSIEVVAEAFIDKSSVDRQRMVYKAIWEELQSAVHAVDEMSCKTPSEAQSS